MAIPVGIVIAIVAARRRQSSRDALLWSLALAAHREMPLGPAVAAFAEQCRGGYRRRVLALADLLQSGVSLPEALGRLPHMLPEAGEVAVRVGWENGILARALRDAAILRTHQPPPWQAVQGRLIYLVFVLTMIQMVTGFVLYFIIPKFKKIFMDFGVELPKLTILVLEVSDFVVEYFYLVVPLLMVLLAYLFVIALGGRTWAPWFLRRLLVRIDTAQILRALAVTMEGGMPLTAGLLALAKTYPRVGIRTDLQRVYEAVNGGADWCASLGSAGLLSTIDGAVLESAQRVGNLPWAMREMAQSGERRLSYRLQVLVQVAFPIIVLCIGMLVFFIASGLFMPLVKLITELSG
jgi:protein transport protein HofC